MAMMMMLFLAIAAGDQTPDLARLLPAEAFLQSRNVPVNMDNMIYLAAKDPEDGKTQIKQLVALRVLADRADDVKKAKSSADIIKTLERIARGELANDRQGFAKEYAAIALARINGTKPPEVKPGKSIKDVLAWYPDTVTFAGAIDLRSREPGTSSAAALDLIWKLIPERGREEIFSAVELMGNFRLERIGGAFVANAKDRGLSEIYLRFSGKGDSKRLVEAMKRISRQDLQVQEEKDPQGMPILFLQERDRAPAMAILGDGEFLMCGYERSNNLNHRALIDKLLAVRAGKQASIFKGALKDALGKLSDKADGVMAGDMPEEMRRDFLRGGILPDLPRHTRAELFRTKEGLDFRLHGSLSSPEDAKKFIDGVAALKERGLQALKEIPPQAKLPAEAIGAMRKALESIQVTGKGAEIEGRALIPSQALLALPAMFFVRELR